MKPKRRYQIGVGQIISLVLFAIDKEEQRVQPILDQQT